MKGLTDMAGMAETTGDVAEWERQNRPQGGNGLGQLIHAAASGQMSPEEAAVQIVKDIASSPDPAAAVEELKAMLTDIGGPGAEAIAKAVMEVLDQLEVGDEDEGAVAMPGMPAMGPQDEPV